MIKSKLRLFGWAVGLSLALGAVGAVAAQGAPVETGAALQTATINFGSGEGSTKVNGTSVSGDDSLGNTWTVTTAGTSSFTQNASYSQIGAKSSPATSITLTATLDASRKITAFYSKWGGFSGTAGTITMTVGETEVATGSLNGTSDVEVKQSTGSYASGVESDSLTITVTGISKGVKLYQVSYACEEATTPASETPTGLTITHGMTKTAYTSDDETWSSSGIEVSVATESGNPWDGDDPVLSFDPATPAAALAEENWDGTVAITASLESLDSEPFNQTGVSVSWASGSAGNPYSVSEANSNYVSNSVKYVSGYLAYVKAGDPSYWLIDDFDLAKSGGFEDLITSSDAETLAEAKAASWELYKASGLTAAQLGDKIVCSGTMANYQSQNEFANGTTGNVIITSNALSAIHAVAADKTYYAGGEIAKSDFTFTADYGSEAGVAISGSAVSITNPSGDVKKYEEGENTITFSYTERGVTKTVNVVIDAEEDVRTPDHIAISGDMDGLAYFDDEEWDETNLSFALVYSDSSSVAIPKDSGFLDYEYQDGEGNPVTSPVAGMTEVNVYAYYDDGDFSDEETITLDGFTVTAVEISQLTWTNKNVSYAVGDTLSIKGTLTAEYNKSDYNVNLTMNTTGIAVTLGGVAVTGSTVLTLSDHGKQLSITYDGLNVTETISVSKVITISSTMSEVASAEGWTTSSGSGSSVVCYTSFELGDLITVSTSGSANCGSYWGSDWRLYQNKSGDVEISVKNSKLYALYSITLTFSNSNNGALLDTDSNVLNSGAEETVSGSNIRFTVGNSGSATNGQIRITAIEVKVLRVNAGYVQNWIDANLHFSDVPTSVKDDTGACAGDEGYYLTAKKALVALNTAHDGVIDEFKDNADFADALARYEAWATNVGDTKPYEGNTIQHAMHVLGAVDNARTPLLVAAFAGVGALAVGGMVFLRKRKEF